MRFLLPAFLLLIITANIHGQSTIDKALEKFNTGSIPYISIEEVLSQDRIYLLDARKKQEYQVSHLQNALWVGYEAFDGKNVQALIPEKDANIIVYCSIGIRSEQIGEKLQELGYAQVKNLYGGIFEWKNKGYPVYDHEGKETQKVHAFDKEWGKLLVKGEKVFTNE